MNDDIASNVLWRRLGYMLTPQLDIYRHLSRMMSGLDVLEIGFGTGFGVLQYAFLAKHVTAIEIDRAAVHFCNTNIPLHNVRWMYGDISGESLNGQIFDAMVMIEVLEHVRDWQVALDNCVKHLRDGGKLWMSARNANAHLRKNDLHEREWTAKELVEALSRRFARVDLWDYTVSQPQSIDTKHTPLIAEATK